MADNGEFANGDTPTKRVKGRKTQEENANDFCRLCGVNLKIKFGNFQKSTKYISTENLFKPSGRAKRGGTTLAELCSEIGLNIVESSVLSSRVCQSCGRKIFNVVELVRFIRSGLERNVEVLICSSDTQDRQVRIKHLLPSSVSSPDRSPQAKKNLYKGRSTSKKSLDFSESTPSNATNKENMPLDLNQETITPRVSDFAAELNVEILCGKQTTQLKVLIVNPNGRIDSHCSFDDETKSIILNACQKNWNTVANMTMKHSHVRQEPVESLRKAVAEEFREYCGDTTDSMLKKSSPEDLAVFSNRILAHEVEIWCPVWMACLKGACNVKELAEENGKAVNSIALSSAVAAKCRNPKMSSAAYRISTILFHSGVKHEDLRLLNKLGVCMSPDSIVQLQRRMGENCESKLIHWKNEIEKVKGASLLLNEVKEKQVGVHNDEEMRVDIDFREETMKSYKFFGPSIFTYCQELFAISGGNLNALTDLDLAAAVNQLTNVKLPYYR